MKVTPTQGLAGIFVFVVLGLSILAKESDDDITYTTTIVPTVELEAEETTPVVEEVEVTPVVFTEEVNHTVTEDNSIVHYNNNGELLVPYPDYDNFSDAFSYARYTLGDSTTTGATQVFVWRGKKYHTETLKQ